MAHLYDILAVLIVTLALAAAITKDRRRSKILFGAALMFFAAAIVAQFAGK